MLWNTLIKKIDMFTIVNPQDPGSQTVVAHCREKRTDITNWLMSYDIRDVDQLRQMIPNAFPKVIRRVPLKVDQNIHGAWRVKPLPLLPFRRDANTGGYIL